MASFTATVTANETFPDGTPITRAMLRNAATPEVALSGSVGAGDIAAGAVTDTEFSSTAGDALAHTKISLTENNLLIGDSSNLGSVLAPSTAGEVMVDTGTDFVFTTTDGSVGGDIDMSYTGGYLKFDLKSDSVEGSHLNANTVNTSFLTISSDKITVANASDPGLLAYGSGGSPTQLTTGTAGRIFVTQGASAPVLKEPYKTVDLAASISMASWMTAAHGISGTPILIHAYFECLTTDLGYSVGDRVYRWHGKDYDTVFSTMYVDSTNVGAYIDGSASLKPYLPHKSTGTQTIITDLTYWKLVAVLDDIA